MHQLLDVSLRTLLQHAQELLRLDQRVKAALDSPLNRHCYVANFRDEILILHVDSAVWATRLRFQLPELTTHMQDKGMPSLRQIRIKVKPPHSTAETIPLPRLVLSTRAAALLRNVAEHSVDAALRATLLRLSGRG